MYGKLVIFGNKITNDIEITAKGHRIGFYNITLRQSSSSTGRCYYTLNDEESFELPISTRVVLNGVTSLKIALSSPNGGDNLCIYEILKSDGTTIKKGTELVTYMEKNITAYLEDNCTVEVLVR